MDITAPCLVEIDVRVLDSQGQLLETTSAPLAYLHGANDIFPALAWPYNALPYVFLGWTALGLVWYFTVKIRKPEVVQAAGTWGDATDPNAAAEEAAALGHAGA